MTLHSFPPRAAGVDLPQMVVVPAGACTLGAPEGERGRATDGSERPVRRVVVQRPFALGRYPVTVGAFAVFAQDTGFGTPPITAPDADDVWAQRPGQSWRAPGFAQSEQHPVAGLNWHDATAYAAWLAARSGQRFRLPTEDEWEYAARSAGGADGPWGAALTGAQANFDTRHAQTGPVDDAHRAATTPVDHFPANPLGLHQMLGDVWEWCARTPDMAARDLAPLKGGSWANGPWCLRPACRLLDPAGFRHATFGMRLALDLE